VFARGRRHLLSSRPFGATEVVDPKLPFGTVPYRFVSGETGEMSVSRSARVLLLAIVVIAGIGVIDAGVTREPDLVALFIAVAVISLTLLTRSLSSRRNLSVRSDLASWVQLRADLTGESPAHIADRAIAHYQLALGESHDAPPDAPTTRSAPQ
jgi:hypothetical protein